MIENRPNWKKVNERVTYMEKFLHNDVDNGETELICTLDRPAQIRESAHSELITRFRERTILEEDKSVKVSYGKQFSLGSRRIRTEDDNSSSSPSSYIPSKFCCW